MGRIRGRVEIEDEPLGPTRPLRHPVNQSPTKSCCP
jgi:hypothetical protein